MEHVLNYAYLCVAFACLAVAIRLALPRILAWRGVSFWWRTRFGPALVFDSADADGTTVRLLNVNGTYQSVCYVDDELLWYPVCAYHRTWAEAVDTTFAHLSGSVDDSEQGPVQQPGDARSSEAHRRALVMGGGGYSFPKWLVAYRPDFSCEAVEIDPGITEIARTHFFIDRLIAEFHTDKTGRLTLATGDAWAYLDAADGLFDLIVNDVFSGNRPMGKLSTPEGARKIHDRLAPGGLYIVNVRTPLEGPRSKTLVETKEVLEDLFSRVELVPERPEEPRRKGNNTLLAWV